MMLRNSAADSGPCFSCNCASPLKNAGQNPAVGASSGLTGSRNSSPRAGFPLLIAVAAEITGSTRCVARTASGNRRASSPDRFDASESAPHQASARPAFSSVDRLSRPTITPAFRSGSYAGRAGPSCRQECCPLCERQRLPCNRQAVHQSVGERLGEHARPRPRAERWRVRSSHQPSRLTAGLRHQFLRRTDE